MPGTVSTNATCVTRRMLQVALLLLLAICTSAPVPTTVKTVQQGATVNEPIISVSTLEKHDQLMAYHGGELSAQYFCDNGTCHNMQASVCQFQVYSEDLCLIIPNVNVSDSGQYNVVLNGHQDVMNLVLRVEVPQRSISPPVTAVPVVLLAGLFLAICSIF
ncbi:hypothetical protein R3I93_019122 [Phoxinus phoxinus]|uniref:Uncharacterized protein n=1 Tax=Phoxinus phoxinus TaxID=58324 RepID=A0AAN9CH43_9TELE